MAERRKRKRWGEVVAADLNVMPLMNLFVVLIPLLLLSAVFVEVSVIEMNQSSSDEPFEQPEEEPLALAIRIHDGAFVVEGNGIQSRTISRNSALAEAGEPDEVAWKELSSALAEIVAAHPSNENIQIIAEETTHYEAIITVMDISREAGLPQAALVARRMGAI
jgi:biopolymer transport protein ExbD